MHLVYVYHCTPEWCYVHAGSALVLSCPVLLCSARVYVPVCVHA